MVNDIPLTNIMLTQTHTLDQMLKYACDIMRIMIKCTLYCSCSYFSLTYTAANILIVLINFLGLIKQGV